MLAEKLYIDVLEITNKYPVDSINLQGLVLEDLYGIFKKIDVYIDGDTASNLEIYLNQITRNSRNDFDLAEKITPLIIKKNWPAIKQKYPHITGEQIRWIARYPAASKRKRINENFPVGIVGITPTGLI